MIFGRTWNGKEEHRERWKHRFAVFPVQLSDGRWFWLVPYWTRTYWVTDMRRLLCGYRVKETVLKLPENRA